MFLAFSFTQFYPGGGEADFIGAYSTFDEAKDAAIGAYGEYSEVYDVAAEEWHDVKP